MRKRTVLGALASLFAGAVVCLAADPNLGTWKLNEAKSKIAPGGTKASTVVYEEVGDQVKITVDGIDGTGKAVHSVWTGRYDGKDYPATGDPTGDTRWYKKVDDRTLEFATKKDGKAVLTGRVAVAADGKSRTVRTSSTDASGKKISSVAVYDKQ